MKPEEALCGCVELVKPGLEQEEQLRDSPGKGARQGRDVEATRTRDAAVTAVQEIQALLASCPAAPTETVLELQPLRQPGLQVALVRAAGSFLPLALIQELLPEEALQGHDWQETVGTRLVLEVLARPQHQVEDVTSCLEAQNFSPQQLARVEGLLARVHSQALASGHCQETVSLSRAALARGMDVVRNIVACREVQLRVLDVVKYFSIEQIPHFDSDEVQMAFLTMARRISSPLQVEEVLLQESQAGHLETLPLLGFKVLVEVAQMNPHGIQSIDCFLLPGDLEPTSCQEARVWLVRLGQQVERLEGQEEVCFTALASCLSSGQAPEHLLRQLPLLDCVPGQASLLGLACRVSSPQEVYRTVASEVLAGGQLLPVVGALALCRLVQSRGLGREEVEALTATGPGLGARDCREERIVWQNIASFLQLAQPAQGTAVQLNLREEKLARALVETVEIIQQERSEEAASVVWSSGAVPPLMCGLGAQLALLSLSERLVGEVEVQEQVTAHLAARRDRARLGVAVLASALQVSGVQEASQVLDLLQPLHLEGAGLRLGTLLCLAHSRAVSVSSVLCWLCRLNMVAGGLLYSQCLGGRGGGPVESGGGWAQL